MSSLIKPAAAAGLVLLGAVLIPRATTHDRATVGSVAFAQSSRAPEAPRTFVKVDAVASPARTIHVPAGQNLQAAIDGARAGDVITLDPGAVYRGPFHLRRTDGNGWIVITSKAADNDLPDAGERVQARHWARMPKLVSATAPVIAADPGAHHVRLLGLEVAPVAGIYLRTLIDLGSDATELSAVPEYIVIDRCYLHGDPRRGARRGIALNARNVAIVDSHFADFKEVGADSQAIAGWNGPGPFRIANNYLEGAGENVMFGGADPRIANLVPSDIEIVGNMFAKPLEWKEGDRALRRRRLDRQEPVRAEERPARADRGQPVRVQLAARAERLRHPVHARNQDGHAPWSVVEDVTFRDNVVRHVAAGINILGQDDNHPSRQTSRIAIVNNVFADVGGHWGHGRLFQLLDGTRDVVIDHNTAFPDRQHPVRRRSPAARRVRLPEQHRAGRIERHLGFQHGAGRADARPLFPGRGGAPQSVHRRHARTVPRRQLLPVRYRRRRASRRLRRASRSRAWPARYAGVGTDGRDPGARLEAAAAATRVEQPDRAQSAGLPDRELACNAGPRRDNADLRVVFWLSSADSGLRVPRLSGARPRPRGLAAADAPARAHRADGHHHRVRAQRGRSHRTAAAQPAVARLPR